MQFIHHFFLHVLNSIFQLFFKCFSDSFLYSGGHSGFNFVEHIFIFYHLLNCDLDEFLLLLMSQFSRSSVMNIFLHLFDVLCHICKVVFNLPITLLNIFFYFALIKLIQFFLFLLFDALEIHWQSTSDIALNLFSELYGTRGTSGTIYCSFCMKCSSFSSKVVIIWIAMLSWMIL